MKQKEIKKLAQQITREVLTAHKISMNIDESNNHSIGELWYGGLRWHCKMEFKGCIYSVDSVRPDMVIAISDCENKEEAEMTLKLKLYKIEEQIQNITNATIKSMSKLKIRRKR